MSDELRIGKYRHFKGGEYDVFGVGVDRDNGNRRVVFYKPLYEDDSLPEGAFWVLSLDKFLGFKKLDGVPIRRYEFIGDES